MKQPGFNKKTLGALVPLLLANGAYANQSHFSLSRRNQKLVAVQVESEVASKELGKSAANPFFSFSKQANSGGVLSSPENTIALLFNQGVMTPTTIRQSKVSGETDWQKDWAANCGIGTLCTGYCTSGCSSDSAPTASSVSFSGTLQVG